MLSSRLSWRNAALGAIALVPAVFIISFAGGRATAPIKVPASAEAWASLIDKAGGTAGDYFIDLAFNGTVVRVDCSQVGTSPAEVIEGYSAGTCTWRKAKKPEIEEYFKKLAAQGVTPAA